jgi:tryptophan synthase alpha chain
MRRLEEVFAKRREAGEKVLITYLCMGDPSHEESIELALVAARAGADVLELGVPFGDPTADGPRIARASERALSRGGGLAATLRAAAAIRERSAVPLVLFGYYNPIFVRGEERVVSEAAQAGVDALLVVDLPIDASAPLRGAAAKRGIHVIPLVAPTSSPDRVRAVRSAHAEAPCGFVYYVSLTGVTGSDAAPLFEASEAAGALRGSIGAPVVVGFGIDSPEKARIAASQTDGVVVGSALVKRIEEGSSPSERTFLVEQLVASLRRALDGAYGRTR